MSSDSSFFFLQNFNMDINNNTSTISFNTEKSKIGEFFFFFCMLNRVVARRLEGMVPMFGG